LIKRVHRIIIRILGVYPAPSCSFNFKFKESRMSPPLRSKE
jgi:hypothetical protein